MHRSEEQEHHEAALTQKPWRIPAGERGEYPTRTFGIDLKELFKRLADPTTSEYEARGLTQSIVLAAGVGNTEKGTEEGKNARRTIVAALTDIGRDPEPGAIVGTYDLTEIRRTARTTLAKHVAPLICARNAWNDGVEHLATLTDIVRFYKHLAEQSVQRNIREEHSGKELANVRDMLERVYLALRSGLGVAAGRDPSSVIPEVVGTVQAALRDLTVLFVTLRWWESLSRVRAVGAIPLLYEHVEVGDRSSPDFIPLRYDWQDIETLRVNGALVNRSYMDAQRDTILHDVAAILAASGGRFDPNDHAGRMQFSGIESLRGLFPLLHDLVATFMREVELACPGVLTDDVPLPEKQTCLQHDECFNESVRKGRAERAMQEGAKREVYSMRFGDTNIFWMLGLNEHRNLSMSRFALLRNSDGTFSFVDTPERRREHLNMLLAVLKDREVFNRARTDRTNPEQRADKDRLATVYGREDAAYADWTTICFVPDISIEHYRAQVAAALDAIK